MNWNMLENNIKGFTFLEITVVIVILGIIATMGYPKIFRELERGRAREAIQVMDQIRKAVIECGISHGGGYAGYQQCQDWDAIGMTNPSNATFSYTIQIAKDYCINATDPSANPTAFNIVAQSVSLYSEIHTGPVVNFLNDMDMTTNSQGVFMYGTGYYEGIAGLRSPCLDLACGSNITCVE